MRAFLLAGLLVSLVSGAAIAQSDPIAQRKAAMKQIGDQTGIGAAMLKGEAPFDAAKAALIFKTFAENGAAFGTLFPAGSDKGDTKAAPAIWSDRAGFDAELAKFNAAVAQNAAGASTADGFKTGFTAVAATCRTCHSTYRLR
ncbi:c-type cytochrome [Aquabacter spiritensis]|uniref:Cytochrome c556 n=1 Tax=Aquabacter spiritensis TaxID=933073 RepID=A0A4R3LVV2_9HYPH|nr:cytochrome c [Aquabacter spiritensis]TCT04704.1 cytochrome c556 [Aquabacter spiritensis]